MAGNFATSCPLCMAVDDPEGMVTVEIDRIVPKSRVTVVLCRSCGSAVVRAMSALGEPLARELVNSQPAAEEPPGGEKALLPGKIKKALDEFEQTAEALNIARRKEEEPDA